MFFYSGSCRLTATVLRGIIIMVARMLHTLAPSPLPPQQSHPVAETTRQSVAVSRRSGPTYCRRPSRTSSAAASAPRNAACTHARWLDMEGEFLQCDTYGLLLLLLSGFLRTLSVSYKSCDNYPTPISTRQIYLQLFKWHHVLSWIYFLNTPGLVVKRNL